MFLHVAIKINCSFTIKFKKEKYKMYSAKNTRTLI